MKALKFKHVYGDPQREKFEQINPTNITSDSSMIKPNGKYTAFVWAGSGGLLCVVETDKPQKLPMNFPMIKGHTGNILDFDWYPFNDQVIATSSMDTSIKVWQVPQEFTEDVTESESTLFGHDKKVNLIQWNPTTSYTIASGSHDSTLKIWDVTKGQQVFNIQSTAQAPLSLEWNTNGSLLGSTWNDKKYRIADARQQKFIHEYDAHAGLKPQRFQWLGNTGYFVTAGFSKTQDREYMLWDITKPSAPVETKTIDNGSGIMFPVYDDSLGMLYISGKGDQSIRYWEFVDGQLHFLTAYKGVNPGKGFGWFPKRTLNVSKCEIMRVAKLEEKTIEYSSLLAPRKSTQFQDDLFPDCASAEPALTFDEWSSGKTSNPKKMSLRPDQGQAQQVQQQQVKLQSNTKPVQQETSNGNLQSRVNDLEKQLQEKNNRIEELEQIIQQLQQNQMN